MKNELSEERLVSLENRDLATDDDYCDVRA